MDTVTFTPSFAGKPITVPMGTDYKINRESGEDGYINDLSFSKEVHPGFPLRVVFLLRADGRLDFWYSEFSGSYNNYLHFGPNDNHEKIKPCTAAQRERLTELFLGIGVPFENMSMHPGAPVLKWANITTEYIAEIAEKAGNKTPAFC